MCNPRHAALLGALSLVTILSSGCASRVTVRSIEPGPVYVGPATHLVLVDGEGRRSAREWVAMELGRQSRTRGYFSFEDRSEEGLDVRVAGRRAEIEGPGAEQMLDIEHAGMRVDVLEWMGHQDHELIEVVDELDQASTETIVVQRGVVLLAITLFGPDGTAYLAETEYEGMAFTEDLFFPREDLIADAAAGAISRFFTDITPRHVVSHVRLDEEDDGQEAILATARAGNMALAAKDMSAYIERNPKSPSAAYNLAVFLDSMGSYAEALESYDRALSLGGKDYYVHARASCARRLANAESLAGSPRAE